MCAKGTPYGVIEIGPGQVGGSTLSARRFILWLCPRPAALLAHWASLPAWVFPRAMRREATGAEMTPGYRPSKGVDLSAAVAASSAAVRDEAAVITSNRKLLLSIIGRPLPAASGNASALLGNTFFQ